MSLSNISSLLSGGPLRSGLLADTVNDAESTRKVYLLAGGLVALGIVLIAITVWFWRNTRHDPELLGPLEIMSGRRFRKLDDGAKQQLLDANRPPDAQPMRWGVGHGEKRPVEEIDLRVAQSSVATGYDDLRDSAPSEPAARPDAIRAVAAGRPVSVDSTSETERDEFAILDDISRPVIDGDVAGAENAGTENAGTENAGTADADTQDAGAPVVAPETTVTERPVKDPTPAAIPLLIIPMDHDLPSAPIASSRSTNGTVVESPSDLAADVTDGADPADGVPDAELRPSIDPLLRTSDRTDS